jgi:hypothetical protein
MSKQCDSTKIIARRALLGLVGAGVLFGPRAFAQNAPSEILAPLNLIYTNLDKPRDPEPFSRRLMALYRAAVKRSEELNAPVSGLDFDYAVNGQDFEPATKRSVRHRIVAQTTTTARVETTFRNGGPQTLVYSLVLEGGRWLIDDVRNPRAGEGWTLSELYKEGAATPKS